MCYYKNWEGKQAIIGTEEAIIRTGEAVIRTGGIEKKFWGSTFLWFVPLGGTNFKLGGYNVPPSPPSSEAPMYNSIQVLLLVILACLKKFKAAIM